MNSKHLGGQDSIEEMRIYVKVSNANRRREKIGVYARVRFFKQKKWIGRNLLWHVALNKF